MNASILFDHAGWGTTLRQVPSPNHDLRPDNEPASLLVIHNISLPPNQYGGNGIIELFTNQLNPAAHPYYEGIAHLRVSAHFLIRRDGEIIQFVPISARAWHAGLSCFEGRERCNDFSIGIELEGCDTEAFTALQYTRLQQLANSLRAALPSLTHVSGHEHIAPGRKTDPGPYFDWQSLLSAQAPFAGQPLPQPQKMPSND